MSSHVRGLRFIAATAFVGASVASMAVEIWAVDNLGTTNAQTVGDRVIRFDSANPAGTVVTVGSTGIASTLMGGLDFDGAGNLFAASQIAGGGSLYSINQTTGAATLIGAMNPGAGFSITDLSWNRVTGTMMALAGNGTSTGSLTSLFSVNLATGNLTLIGSVTGLAASHISVGLATDNSGTNYIHDIVTDRMFSVVGTTATQMSSTIGIDTNFSQGMTIDSSNNWFLGDISSNPAFASEVRQMNLATGGTTTILGTWPIHAANGLPEFETGDLAVKAVPEPASIAALGLGLAAIARRRRNKKA